MSDIITAVQIFLQKNRDDARAQKEKDYLYSDLKHYGVAVWQRRKLFQKYKREIGKMPKSEALKLVKKLWAAPSFEERAFGLGVLNTKTKDLDQSDIPLIEKMMRESKGWALLDSLIIPIMPHLLEKYPETFKYLKKWFKDDDFWVRRSALLAQNKFFRRGSGGDKKLFFELAKSQFDESWIDKKYARYKKDPKHFLHPSRARFFIRKAIGWAIREMSRKDPESAYQFLKENKDKMSGLSFRDGSRKLPDKYKEKLKD